MRSAQFQCSTDIQPIARPSRQPKLHPLGASVVPAIFRARWSSHYRHFHEYIGPKTTSSMHLMPCTFLHNLDHTSHTRSAAATAEASGNHATRHNQTTSLPQASAQLHASLASPRQPLCLFAKPVAVVRPHSRWLPSWLLARFETPSSTVEEYPRRTTSLCAYNSFCFARDAAAPRAKSINDNWTSSETVMCRRKSKSNFTGSGVSSHPFVAH